MCAWLEVRNNRSKQGIRLHGFWFMCYFWWLHQRGSDENGRPKERAKDSVWLNHEHTRTQTVLQGLALGWSEFETNLFYAFMCLLSIILPWQIVLYTVIGPSGTQLDNFTDPCETLVGHRVFLVTTGCRSSVLALRFTDPHLLIMERCCCKYSIVIIADTYSDNSVALLNPN